MANIQLPLSIMETWSPQQKLAVYDLCRLISETLWQQDRDALLDAMIRDDQQRGLEHTDDLLNTYLERPFEDDLSF